MAYEDEDEEYWAAEAARKGIRVPKDETKSSSPIPKSALPHDEDEDDDDDDLDIEEEADPDFPEDPEELKRRFLAKKAGKKLPPTPVKSPAASPASTGTKPPPPGGGPIGTGPGAPTPPATTPPPPPAAKPGECCARMKKEALERTNAQMWKDHKGGDIVVFAHNMNKMIHCPWCGAKI
jgi:hypothetical protein